jgi:AraC-like DNA-binding protein
VVSDGASVLGFDPLSMACAAIVAEADGPGPAVPGACADAATGQGGSGLRARLARAMRLARRAAAFFPSEESGAALVFEPDLDRCRAVASAVAAQLLGDGGGALRVGVGRAYAQWIDAPRAYAEARAALAYRLIREPTKPYFYVQASEDWNALGDLRSSGDRLCLGIRTGAVGRVGDLALSFVAALDSAELSPQRVRHEVLALFSRAHDELAGIGVSTTALSTKLACDYYRFAESLDRPDAIRAALVRLAEVAAGTLEASSHHEPEWKILDFKEHVAKHFAEPELSISGVAQRLSISESYLSKLLRRRLGLSFVDYVSDFRVARAKELLASSDMMGYEVAESVGYPDARYFASLFKRRTGLTPSEYRKTLAAEGGTAGQPGSEDGPGTAGQR